MTNLKNQVAKCIRYEYSPLLQAFYRTFAVLLFASVLLLKDDTAAAQPIVLLNDDNPTQDISASSLMWVDTKGQSSVTQVVAAGLMPLKGLKPEVVLQFHAAAVLLGERPGSSLDINNALAETLQNMGPRTRRPIRFLEPELTIASPLEAQSEFEPDQTDPEKRSSQQSTWAI